MHSHSDGLVVKIPLRRCHINLAEGHQAEKPSSHHLRRWPRAGGSRHAQVPGDIWSCAHALPPGAGRGGFGGRPRALGVFAPGPAHPAPGQPRRARTGRTLCRRGSPADVCPGAKRQAVACLQVSLLSWGSAEVCGGCASASFGGGRGQERGSCPGRADVWGPRLARFSRNEETRPGVLSPGSLRRGAEGAPQGQTVANPHPAFAFP